MIAGSRLVETVIDDWLLRLRLPLPLGIDHVNCYFARGDDGGWILIDTGLGHTAAADVWRDVLADIGEPITRIVVTHNHPDHLGCAAIVARLTGATVYQGRVDYGIGLAFWRSPDTTRKVTDFAARHGMPRPIIEATNAYHENIRRQVQLVAGPEFLDEGDVLAGWDVLCLPGHAHGHLALLREGVLLPGDAILGTITPHIGLDPWSSSDPLDDYFSSLARIAELAPKLAAPGHHEILEAPVARARSIAEHHELRLQLVESAARQQPRTAFDLCMDVFPEDLPPILRHFALLETLAHAEYLALRDRIERTGSSSAPLYVAR